MNPDENGAGLKLNISESDNSLDFDLALSVISWFRLAPKKAESMLTAVRRSVSNWRAVANHCHIKKSRQDEMEPAFRY
jgi:serine/threonine-protein kinase HipA